LLADSRSTGAQALLGVQRGLGSSLLELRGLPPVALLAGLAREPGALAAGCSATRSAGSTAARACVLASPAAAAAAYLSARWASCRALVAS
jgi:hypothetical protein